MKGLLKNENQNNNLARLFLVVTLFSLFVTDAMAQIQTGGGALEQATSALGSYFKPVQQLCYAIAAIIGFIGAIKVYGKFTQGDPDVGKAAASWFGACLFMVLAGTVLGAFFRNGMV